MHPLATRVGSGATGGLPPRACLGLWFFATLSILFSFIFIIMSGDGTELIGKVAGEAPQQLAVQLDARIQPPRCVLHNRNKAASDSTCAYSLLSLAGGLPLKSGCGRRGGFCLMLTRATHIACKLPRMQTTSLQKSSRR